MASKTIVALLRKYYKKASFNAIINQKLVDRSYYDYKWPQQNWNKHLFINFFQLKRVALHNVNITMSHFPPQSCRYSNPFAFRYTVY